MTAPLEEDTDLQVEELAVASVDDLGAAIAPAHLDNVHLVGETGQDISSGRSQKGWILKGEGSRNGGGQSVCYTVVVCLHQHNHISAGLRVSGLQSPKWRPADFNVDAHPPHTPKFF